MKERNLCHRTTILFQELNGSSLTPNILKMSMSLLVLLLSM